MANNIDKLFAFKALEQKVKEQREMLEYECRDELIEAYEADGTDGRRSPMFGKEAGKYSIKVYKATPDKVTERFEMDDWDAFSDWIDANADAARDFAFVKGEAFAAYWMAKCGELPDGISLVRDVEPGKPERVSAQVYSFKPDIVIEKLSEGGNLFERANALLLGDGGDD